jgi:murein DD-endopeptidase MepM/ murein hydrolase activator NlpD
MRPLSLASLLPVLSFYAVLVLAISAVAPGVSLALDTEQRRIFDSNVLYFDHEGTARQCRTGGTLSGSNNAERIWNFFTGRGLHPPQVAGLMGNFQAESGLNPRRVQNTRTPQGDADYPTNGIGFGLAQWTFTARQRPLVELAEANNVLPGDLEIQLRYVMQELEGPYRSVYDDLLATQDVDRATDIIMVRYEGPRDQSESAKEHRREFSREFLATYGSTSGSPGSDSASCQEGPGGQVVGNYSLPTDRRWYDENPQWFTKPHHDYPAADIPVPTGTPIYSMSGGRVISAGMGGACGLGVVIDAGDGVTFTYCHGSDGGSVPGARVGNQVQPGQLIMHSASTGRSTGPHLHLGLKTGSQNRCPQNLFVSIAEGNPSDVNSLPTSGCTY